MPGRAQERPTPSENNALVVEIKTGDPLDLTRLYVPDLRGIAVTTEDKLLMVEVVRNIRNRDWDALPDRPWIVVGPTELTSQNRFLVKDGVFLTPRMLARMYEKTNYNPLYCMVGFYADMRSLAPEQLMSFEVPCGHVSEMFNLDINDRSWQSLYVEQFSNEIFKRVLTSQETIKRFTCAVNATMRTAREAFFYIYRNPEYYDLPAEVLHTMVYLGDYDSNNIGPHWNKVRERSYLVTTLDLKRELDVEDFSELAKRAEEDRVVLARFETARQNEWELLRKNLPLLIPGAIKGSVIETEKGAGPGYYVHSMVHTHPIIDPKGEVQPSLADLTSLVQLRHQHHCAGAAGYQRHERTGNRPFSIILQPTTESGRSFVALIHREKDIPPRKELPVRSSEELGAMYMEHGVHATLERLGFVSATLKYVNGRTKADIDAVVQLLD